jgi:hypothetical protein
LAVNDGAVLVSLQSAVPSIVENTLKQVLCVQKLEEAIVQQYFLILFEDWKEIKVVVKCGMCLL